MFIRSSNVTGQPLFYLCYRAAFSETRSPEVGLSAPLICSHSILCSLHHSTYFLSVVHVLHPSLPLSLRTEIAFLSEYVSSIYPCLVLNICLLSVFKWMVLTLLILILCHCRLLLVALIKIYFTPNFGVFSRNCFYL